MNDDTLKNIQNGVVPTTKRHKTSTIRRRSENLIGALLNPITIGRQTTLDKVDESNDSLRHRSLLEELNARRDDKRIVESPSDALKRKQLELKLCNRREISRIQRDKAMKPRRMWHNVNRNIRMQSIEMKNNLNLMNASKFDESIQQSKSSSSPSKHRVHVKRVQRYMKDVDTFPDFKSMPRFSWIGHNDDDDNDETSMSSSQNQQQKQQQRHKEQQEALKSVLKCSPTQLIVDWAHQREVVDELKRKAICTPPISAYLRPTLDRWCNNDDDTHTTSTSLLNHLIDERITMEKEPLSMYERCMTLYNMQRQTLITRTIERFNTDSSSSTSSLLMNDDDELYIESVLSPTQMNEFYSQLEEQRRHCDMYHEIQYDDTPSENTTPILTMKMNEVYTNSQLETNYNDSDDNDVERDQTKSKTISMKRGMSNNQIMDPDAAIQLMDKNTYFNGDPKSNSQQNDDNNDNAVRLTMDITLGRRLSAVCDTLQLSPLIKQKMIQKYMKSSSTSSYNVIDAWERAANAIMKRETLKDRIIIYESIASHPWRLFTGSSIGRLHEQLHRRQLKYEFNIATRNALRAINYVKLQYNDNVMINDAPYTIGDRDYHDILHDLQCTRELGCMERCVELFQLRLTTMSNYECKQFLYGFQPSSNQNGRITIPQQWSFDHHHHRYFHNKTLLHPQSIVLDPKQQIKQYVMDMIHHVQWLNCNTTTRDQYHPSSNKQKRLNIVRLKEYEIKKLLL